MPCVDYGVGCLLCVGAVAVAVWYLDRYFVIFFISRFVCDVAKSELRAFRHHWWDQSVVSGIVNRSRKIKVMDGVGSYACWVPKEERGVLCSVLLLPLDCFVTG